MLFRSNLVRVWSYHTGEPGATWENTPIVVGNVMYFATQKNRVVALEPESGKELWIYDPKSTRTSEHRGVSYWPGDSKTRPRVILATEGRLIALDAKSGKPALDLGQRLDDVLAEFYCWCVDHDVPVMAHTSASNGTCPEFMKLAGSKYWALALEKCPALRI